jgi:hypothetical protein
MSLSRATFAQVVRRLGITRFELSRCMSQARTRVSSCGQPLNPTQFVAPAGAILLMPSTAAPDNSSVQNRASHSPLPGTTCAFGMIRPSVSLFSVRGHFGMWSCGYHVSWGISGSRRRVQLAAAANGRLGVFPGEWGRGRFEGARAQSSKPIPQTDAPGADQNSTPRAAGSPEIEVRSAILS